MKTPIICSLLVMALLACPIDSKAGWFSNEHFVVEPFTFEMTCRNGLQVLEVEAVQQRSYAMHLVRTALPSWKFIRVCEENILDDFSQNGSKISISIKGNTMKLEEFDYVKRYGDEPYTAKEIGYYSDNAGIRLVRGDFDLKLLLCDESGKKLRMRVRALGNEAMKDSLSRVRSKRLTRHLRNVLNGLHIDPPTEAVGSLTLVNPVSGKELDGQCNHFTFTVPSPLTFEIHHKRYGNELVDVSAEQTATYGKVINGKMEIGSIATRIVPVTLEEHSYGNDPIGTHSTRIGFGEGQLDLPTTNPDDSGDGTLQRVDLDVLMIVRRKNGELYRCRASILGDEVDRMSLIKMTGPHAKSWLKSVLYPVCLRLNDEDLRLQHLPYRSNTGVRGIACKYERLPREQKQVERFDRLNGNH